MISYYISENIINICVVTEAKYWFKKMIRKLYFNLWDDYRKMQKQTLEKLHFAHGRDNLVFHKRCLQIK